MGRGDEQDTTTRDPDVVRAAVREHVMHAAAQAGLTDATATVTDHPSVRVHVEEPTRRWALTGVVIVGAVLTEVYQEGHRRVEYLTGTSRFNTSVTVVLYGRAA